MFCPHFFSVLGLEGSPKSAENARAWSRKATYTTEEMLLEVELAGGGPVRLDGLEDLGAIEVSTSLLSKSMSPCSQARPHGKTGRRVSSV